MLKAEWKQYGRLPNRLFKIMAGITAYEGNGGAIFPSLDTLANDSGMHRSKVLAAIKELESLGAVEVDRKFGRPNRYRIATTFQGTSTAGATGTARATSTHIGTGTAGAFSLVPKPHSTGTAEGFGLVPPGVPEGLREGKNKKGLREGKTSATASALVGFDQFWAVYPLKVAKQNARKAWSKIRPDAELLARMLTAIEAQKRSPQWTKDAGQFIPHPASWLNAHRWEDESVTATASFAEPGRDWDEFTEVPSGQN